MISSEPDAGRPAGRIVPLVRRSSGRAPAQNPTPRSDECGDSAYGAAGPADGFFLASG